MPQTSKLQLELFQNSAANQTLGNTSFAQLNQLVQAAVVGRTNTPPGSPADEALYIITATAAGDWAGKENQLAYWLTGTGAWQYIVPREGMLVHVNNEDVYYKYTGSAWAVFSGGGMSNPMTTSGDIIIGGASGTPQRLGPGTDTYVLTMVSGVPAWQAPSGSGGTAGDMLSPLLSSEVSITGAVTLTSTAFGKMHVCSGTTADYTVGLPAVSGNAGKFIGFRMAPGLTKVVTLDPSGSELINGTPNYALMANETAVIYCDGSAWFVLCQAGKPFSGARVSISANKSIPSSTLTRVTFDVEDYDDGGYVDLASSTTNITIPITGLYRVSFFSTFASNATGRRVARVQNSAGTVIYARCDMPAVPGGGVTTPNGGTDVKLTAGTEINLMVFQDSGGALDLTSNSFERTVFAIQRLK